MKKIYFLAILIVCLATLYTLNFGQEKSYSLFFYHEATDISLNEGNIACDGRAVIPVVRTQRRAPSLEQTLRLLIEHGPTPEEEVLGFSSEFPHQDFKLIALTLNNGVAELTFTNVPGFTSGGSCRVNLLRTQIEKTVLQFKEVKEVRILPVDILQP